MNATSTETYEVPTMRASNLSRPGGIMTVNHIDTSAIEVILSMPNPASVNLPWIEISRTIMTPLAFDSIIRPCLLNCGAKRLS